jgi:hypothetical protein
MCFRIVAQYLRIRRFPGPNSRTICQALPCPKRESWRVHSEQKCTSETKCWNGGRRKYPMSCHCGQHQTCPICMCRRWHTTPKRHSVRSEIRCQRRHLRSPSGWGRTPRHCHPKGTPWQLPNQHNENTGPNRGLSGKTEPPSFYLHMVQSRIIAVLVRIWWTPCKSGARNHQSLPTL